MITVPDDQHTETIRALDGEPLPAELAAQLTCDARLQALLVGPAGQPLWLGRTSRLATAAQRRALTIRDGGCVFPGCTMPAEWCDVHHQPGWHHDGTTDPDHMVLLCRRHHGAAHTNRWTLHPTPDPPASETVPSTTPSRQRTPPGNSPPGQRYHWYDHHQHRTHPAQQRGPKPAA